MHIFSLYSYSNIINTIMNYYYLLNVDIFLYKTYVETIRFGENSSIYCVLWIIKFVFSELKS